jgi:PilZ domain
MEQVRPYHREHYRLPLPVSYPVMFSDDATIGEGMVTNLSVFGCTIECSDTVPERTRLLLRLILPDQNESLPIQQAEVRWVKGRQVGLRFGQLERAANLRLHIFVWDRMLERLQALKQ